MNLSINTNIAALTTMRQIGITEGNMQTSITRLSTGLRINSAMDDPAGMVISEGLRSQISAINQAVRNSQDAINMSKTAEGAMQEVASLLQSLNSLAVGSANTAVIDSNQLQANQTQVRSILTSINRIAEQTTWGTKKLLNGASGSLTNITNTNLVNSMFVGSNFNGQTVRSGPINMTRTVAATQTTTGPLATTFASAVTAVNQGVFAINGTTFQTDPGETVASLVTKINSQAGNTNVQATYASGSGVTLTSSKFGKIPISYTETSNILNGGVPANPAVGVDAVYNVTLNVEPNPATASEVFTGSTTPGDDGLTLTSPSGNRMVVTPAGNATTGATTIGALSVGTMRFQTGGDANQYSSLSLPSVFAKDLGLTAVPGQTLASLDVTNQTGATNAIKIINDAIQQIAVARGGIGSFQANNLQSNVRSLTIASENLTASDSQIRDADMAVEMTNYTKQQVLRQSGLSILAQANQQPQSILQLLKGA